MVLQGLATSFDNYKGLVDQINLLDMVIEMTQDAAVGIERDEEEQ